LSIERNIVTDEYFEHLLEDLAVDSDGKDAHLEIFGLVAIVSGDEDDSSEIPKSDIVAMCIRLIVRLDSLGTDAASGLLRFLVHTGLINDNSNVRIRIGDALLNHLDGLNESLWEFVDAILNSRKAPNPDFAQAIFGPAITRFDNSPNWMAFDTLISIYDISSHLVDLDSLIPKFLQLVSIASSGAEIALSIREQYWPRVIYDELKRLFDDQSDNQSNASIQTFLDGITNQAERAPRRALVAESS
jgi:hypothetical protein